MNKLGTPDSAQMPDAAPRLLEAKVETIGAIGAVTLGSIRGSISDQRGVIYSTGAMSGYMKL